MNGTNDRQVLDRLLESIANSVDDRGVSQTVDHEALAMLNELNRMRDSIRAAASQPTQDDEEQIQKLVSGLRDFPAADSEGDKLKRESARILDGVSPTTVDDSVQTVDSGDSTQRSSLSDCDTKVSPSGNVLDRLGPFPIGKKLGEGASGVVYALEDDGLARNYNVDKLAIKIYRRATAPNSVDRIRREISGLTGMRSQYAAKIFDFGHVHETPYIVIERIDGVRLDEYAGLNPPVEAICEVLRQLCLALSDVHQSGVVHRDIKPSNIIIEKSGRLKIVDFGLVSTRQQDEENDTQNQSLRTATRTTLGTVDWMSPEQIRDSKRADFRSDYYALGCVAYFLVEGRPPFPAEQFPSKLARIMAHLSLPAPQMKNERHVIPDALSGWIMQLLAKTAEDRPPELNAGLKTLEALASHEALLHSLSLI